MNFEQIQKCVLDVENAKHQLEDADLSAKLAMAALQSAISNHTAKQCQLATRLQQMANMLQRGPKG
jgi:hypothetical protein